VLALLLASPSTASAATGITFDLSPATPTYGGTATFSGIVTGGNPGDQVDLLVDTGSGWNVVTSTSTASDGTYAFSVAATTPGSYAAQTQGATSSARVLALRPRLTSRVAGLLYPGSRVLLKGRLAPVASGTLTLHQGGHSRSVAVRSDGRYSARLTTRSGGRHRARLVFSPHNGFVTRQLIRRYRLSTPSLSIGSSGKSVLALELRLRRLHYALRPANQFYGVDTYEAVLAFQKVHRMNRTGHVGWAVWNKLGVARVPKARRAFGDHIEVDKTRQVLFEVRRGIVVRVIHVSTGATGNTPVGNWHVYWKQAGLNSHGMYYSLYWLRGFAIHGYASVPAVPASHGCVRIPMWLAPGLYSRWGLGTAVYVYYSF
jgi:L,D-transpeptidase catalytic domain/Putative peptidoglycan binding domain